MLLEVFDCEVVAGEDVVRETIDLDVASHAHVRWCDPLHVLVNILVLVTAQEGTFDNARVLHRWFVNRDTVVSEMERDDETAINILRNSSVEAGGVTQDLLVIVNRLEEITLGLFGHKVVDVAKSVDLVSKTVEWGNLAYSRLRGSWAADSAELKLPTELVLVVFLRVIIDTLDVVGAAESTDRSITKDLVAGQVIVTNEVETGLIHVGSEGDLLSLQKLGESVTAVIRVMHLTNLDCVVSQEIMDNERQILTLTEEAKDLAIVIKELLNAVYVAATKGLLLVLAEFSVVRPGNLHQGSVKTVLGNSLGFRLGASEFLKEFPSVLITVGNADCASVDSHIEADTEVLGHEWTLSISLQHHLAVEEGTLGHTRVDLFGLNHED